MKTLVLSLWVSTLGLTWFLWRGNVPLALADAGLVAMFILAILVEASRRKD